MTESARRKSYDDLGTRGRRVDHRLHLVPVTDPDPVPELVLNHHQVIQVIVDVGGEALFVP